MTSKLAAVAEIIDTTTRARDPVVRELLQDLAWSGDDARLERLVESSTQGARLLACEQDDS
jgi:hypothetical protein